MSNYSLVILFTSIISLLGTMIGTIFGIIIRNPTNKFLSYIMGIASGIMLSIVCLNLLPESIKNSGIFFTIIYFFIGVIIILIINKLYILKNNNANELTKVAFLVILGLSIHNLPEGLIMGCGIGIGSSLGVKMSLLIVMHDIPEGIAVAAPLMAARQKVSKIIFYSFLSSVPTMVGALIGLYLGVVSKETLGILFAFVSGIMSYIICREMIPESSKFYNGVITTLGVVVGIILGIVMIKVF
ncbi:ZIP family metal transporter [Haloimpatiens sp. FM7330]|uniref:ZIP family metal transporter n=1 Tax=Haloimpatiens sp. FM7330 TaxID=3298610 RepID=UPI0036332EF1